MQELDLFHMLDIHPLVFQPLRGKENHRKSAKKQEVLQRIESEMDQEIPEALRFTPDCRSSGNNLACRWPSNHANTPAPTKCRFWELQFGSKCETLPESRAHFKAYDMSR